MAPLFQGGGLDKQFLKYCVDFIEKRNKSTQNDVVIIGDVAADSSSSGSWFNVGLRAIENVSSSEEPIDVEKLEDFVDPLKLQQDQFTDITESEASSDEDKEKEVEFVLRPCCWLSANSIPNFCDLSLVWIN
ncbi:hypothetical protein H5410_011087 [Solanum commersonii]|uniref:Uncharacterized protein n=1 Tax=Solanum commersonii TaxID=4109 RepID=A0A9J6AML5_SOLCO|nr:hypothetical protein H5410_011087 [Solanum commersonii]